MSISHPLEDTGRRASFTSTSLMSRDPVSAFLRDKQFPILAKKTIGDVPLNFSGVHSLSESQCWDAVRATCERCLQLGFTPHENLQYRLGYVLSQFKLHHYDSANKVLDSLGDLHNSGNYFYESYPQIYNKNTPQGERKGNMVPWTMLLLKAVMPHFDQSSSLGKYSNLPPVPTSTTSPSTPPQPPAEADHVNQLNSHGNINQGTQVALDRLYRLLNMCRKSNLQQRFDATCTQEEWNIREVRVTMMIINCHICKKEYYLALELLCQIIQKLEQNSTKDEESLDLFIAMKSMQGCLYLQSGVIPQAEAVFQVVKQRANQNNTGHKIRCLMNEGFLLFTKGKFTNACKEFAQVLEIDPDHVHAANNEAICLLHMCQLSKAIEVLEEIIRRNPPKNLDEVVVYNLCTLYELEADVHNNEKIGVIRTLVDRYVGDDFFFSHTAS
jgi:tetratricopeptide (TPR) repeat protein